MSVVLHLSAGQGPEECRWVVARLAEAFAAEAAAAGLACAVVEAAPGNPASLLLEVTGEGADAFAAARTGTIRWVGTSLFRPRHKRRNWFVAVARVPEPESLPDFREADIAWQAMRASGPGGQHVNKTDSAVRATHRPTGLSVVAQEQRSQHANRRLARLKLAMLLAEHGTAAAADARRAEWDRNQSLERGNEVRTYAGERFVLKVLMP